MTEQLTAEKIAREIAKLYGVGDTPDLYPGPFRQAVKVIANALLDTASALLTQRARADGLEARVRELEADLEEAGRSLRVLGRSLRMLAARVRGAADEA